MQNIFPGSRIPLGWTGQIPYATGGGGNNEPNIPNPPPMEPQQNNRIGQVADKLSAKKPMNVVIKDEMTPFQKGSLALRGAALENTRDNQSANRDLAGKRVDIAAFKANHPNKRFITVKGGNIMAMDPLTGEAEDTGISSGSLTDQEKADLTQHNTEKNENTRQTNRLEVVDTQHNNRMDEKQYEKDNPDDEWSNPVQTFNPDGSAALIVQVNKKDGKTRTVQTPGAIRNTAPGTQNPMLPSQEINARKLKIQETLARNPNWKRYVNAETGEIAGVGTGFGDADLTQIERDKIVEALYGKGNEPAKTTNTEVPPNTDKAPPAPAGWKYVPKAGGGWTAVKSTGGE